MGLNNRKNNPKKGNPTILCSTPAGVGNNEYWITFLHAFHAWPFIFNPFGIGLYHIICYHALHARPFIFNPCGVVISISSVSMHCMHGHSYSIFRDCKIPVEKHSWYKKSHPGFGTASCISYECQLFFNKFIPNRSPYSFPVKPKGI